MFLLFLFLAVLSSLRFEAEGIDGHLQLSVDCFHHPSQKVREGKRCDYLSDCDPHFRFCLTDVDPKISECRLAKKEFAFEDQVRLGACNSGRRRNLPRIINFNVTTASSRLFLFLTITEQNKYSGNKLIDRLVYSVLPGPVVRQNGTKTPSLHLKPLKISNRDFRHSDQPLVELSAVFTCAQNRYGPSCSVVCVPNAQYACLEDGSRRCSPGWRGENCSQTDHCLKQPCKDWATCRHVNNTFQCECDGRIGPQCRAGLDPCLNHRCAHGATCVSHDDRPKCQCAPGWLGRLCTQQDPCTQPDVCGPQGRCSVISETLNATCECKSGWSGPKCDEKITTTPQPTQATVPVVIQKVISPKQGRKSTIAIAVLSCLVVAILIAMATLFLRWRRRRKRKLYMHRHVVRGNPVYRIGDSERPECEYESEYEDAEDPVAFDSGIYADPGAVYSCGDESERSQESEVAPPLPPQTKGEKSRTHPNSNVSGVSSNRTEVRFVRP